MGENNKNLKLMIRKYKPKGYDWMNFNLTRRNPYTFHHIVSRSDGGEDSINNGAILTRRAHDLLHLLEFVCPSAFNDLQNVFIRINRSQNGVTDEDICEIDSILYGVFNNDGYEFDSNVDLSKYMEIYYGIKKSKIKKLKK